MKIGLLLSSCLCGIVASAAEPFFDHSGWTDLNRNGRKEVYEDSAQSVAKRVTDLLARMTIEEKIGQLQQVHEEANSATRLAGRLRQGRIGSFLDGSELIDTPLPRNRLQHLAV